MTILDATRRATALDPTAFYQVLYGRLTVVGKQPDGDSVRFVADRPELWKRLYRADRLRPSRDGSVQLRLEAIDAPELHYNGEEQPLGAEARDTLLTRVGFRELRYLESPPSQVVEAVPETRPAAILARSVDPNGRAVAYLLAAAERELVKDGAVVEADDAVLAATANEGLLADGSAYLTLYTSTPAMHRERFRAVARAARSADRGVWAADATGGFTLTGPASIGLTGQLVLPKLFRRCTDYLDDRERGFVGTLVDWLLAHSSGSQDENDLLVLADGLEVPLSAVVKHKNRTVRLDVDPIEVTFVER